MFQGDRVWWPRLRFKQDFLKKKTQQICMSKLLKIVVIKITK